MLDGRCSRCTAAWEHSDEILRAGCPSCHASLGWSLGSPANELNWHEHRPNQDRTLTLPSSWQWFALLAFHHRSHGATENRTEAWGAALAAGYIRVGRSPYRRGSQAGSAAPALDAPPITRTARSWSSRPRHIASRARPSELSSRSDVLLHSRCNRRFVSRRLPRDALLGAAGPHSSPCRSIFCIRALFGDAWPRSPRRPALEPNPRASRLALGRSVARARAQHASRGAERDRLRAPQWSQARRRALRARPLQLCLLVGGCACGSCLPHAAAGPSREHRCSSTRASNLALAHWLAARWPLAHGGLAEASQAEVGGAGAAYFGPSCAFNCFAASAYPPSAPSTK